MKQLKSNEEEIERERREREKLELMIKDLETRTV